MDAVLREELAPLVTGNEVVLVFLAMPLLVRLLNASATRGVVAGNGKTNHASVAELHRLLHKALAKGSAPDNRASVVVLNGPCEDFACTRTTFVHKHHNRELLEGAATIAMELFTRTLATFRIDNQLACRQELVYHLNGDVHIASTIAAKVHDELLHAFHIEVGKSDKHLRISLLAEVLDANVARLIAHHVIGIDADHGNVATNHGEVLQIFCAVTLDAELHLRTLLALEVLHHVFALHSHK